MIRESTPAVAATPGLRPVRVSVLSGRRSPAKMHLAHHSGRVGVSIVGPGFREAPGRLGPGLDGR